MVSCTSFQGLKFISDAVRDVELLFRDIANDLQLRD